MVRRDGAEARKERIEKITKLVEAMLNRDKEPQLSQTLACLAYETGLTEDKLMEYLRISEKLGRFTLDLENDKIRKYVEN